MVGTQPTMPSRPNTAGGNASAISRQARASAGRPSVKRIQPLTRARPAAAGTDSSGCSRTSSRSRIGRPTPCAGAERVTQASGGGMSGMGIVSKGGPAAPGSPRSPIVANSSSRALPSWTSVALTVPSVRPLRSSCVSMWQGMPARPGRR